MRAEAEIVEADATSDDSRKSTLHLSESDMDRYWLFCKLEDPTIIAKHDNLGRSPPQAEHHFSVSAPWSQGMID